MNDLQKSTSLIDKIAEAYKNATPEEKKHILTVLSGITAFGMLLKFLMSLDKNK